MNPEGPLGQVAVTPREEEQREMEFRKKGYETPSQGPSQVGLVLKVWWYTVKVEKYINSTQERYRNRTDHWLNEAGVDEGDPGVVDFCPEPPEPGSGVWLGKNSANITTIGGAADNDSPVPSQKIKEEIQEIN